MNQQQTPQQDQQAENRPEQGQDDLRQGGQGGQSAQDGRGGPGGEDRSFDQPRPDQPGSDDIERDSGLAGQAGGQQQP